MTYSYPTNPPWVMGSSLHTVVGMGSSLETVFGMGNPPQGSTFLPSSLTGLVLWLDANQIAGIVSGTSISAWTDQSGQANHVTQASAASQPVFVTNVLNGKPAVQFNGGQTLAGPDLDLPTTAHVVGAVSAFSTAPSGVHYAIIEKGVLGAGQQYAIAFQNTTTVLQYNYFISGVAQEVATANTANSANSYKAHVVTWNGSAYSFYRSGVADGSLTTTLSGSLQNQLVRVGGDTDSSSNFLKGNITEVFLYNRILTSAELTQLNSYLKTKWAV